MAILTDPFFQISSPPGSHVKDYALAVGKARFVGEPVVAVVAETRELARDAAELVEVEYEPLAAVDAREARRRRAPSSTTRPAATSCGTASSTGATRRRRSRTPTTSSDRGAPLRPLQLDPARVLDGAIVEYNRGIGQWTIQSNNQFPGFAIIMMAPAMRVGLDKLRFVSQDIGGGFGNKITSHPHFVALLPARPQARPPGQLDRVADRLPPENVARERALVPGRRGRRQGRRDAARLPRKALDDAARSFATSRSAASSGRRSRPGCYRWRNIRLDFTQVMTNKAPVSPNRGYSRMQHLWFTERIIDIVARRARARSRRGAQAELHQGRGDAVRDAERLRLRLRRLRPQPRHRARPRSATASSRRGGPTRPPAGSSSASASARRSTPARTTSASRA